MVTKDHPKLPTGYKCCFTTERSNNSGPLRVSQPHFRGFQMWCHTKYTTSLIKHSCQKCLLPKSSLVAWHCHCCGSLSLLWLRFDPWHRNVHMPWARLKNKTKGNLILASILFFSPSESNLRTRVWSSFPGVIEQGGGKLGVNSGGSSEGTLPEDIGLEPDELHFNLGFSSQVLGFTGQVT